MQATRTVYAHQDTNTYTQHTLIYMSLPQTYSHVRAHKHTRTTHNTHTAAKSAYSGGPIGLPAKMLLNCESSSGSSRIRGSSEGTKHVGTMHSGIIGWITTSTLTRKAEYTVPDVMHAFGCWRQTRDAGQMRDPGQTRA